jgi:hypothetical protein
MSPSSSERLPRPRAFFRRTTDHLQPLRVSYEPGAFFPVPSIRDACYTEVVSPLSTLMALQLAMLTAPQAQLV